jgi:TolA-binding protein
VEDIEVSHVKRLEETNKIYLAKLNEQDKIIAEMQKQIDRLNNPIPSIKQLQERERLISQERNQLAKPNKAKKAIKKEIDELFDDDFDDTPLGKVNEVVTVKQKKAPKVQKKTMKKVESDSESSDEEEVDEDVTEDM